MEAGSSEVSLDNIAVPTETISESTFLLTELRYTLGQLHVQLSDLAPEVQERQVCDGRSVAQTLRDMMAYERRYQAEYSRMLGLSLDETTHEEGFVGGNTLETQRGRTVALLEKAGDSWPEELINLVRDHVMHDRQHTTMIADCRRRLFDEDSRPDLNEPLTAAQ